MNKQPAAVFALVLSAIVIAPCAVFGWDDAVHMNDDAALYIDDGQDFVELDSEGIDAGSPGLEPLAEGLEPLEIEPAFFEPDDLGGIDSRAKVMGGSTGPLVGTNYIRIYISGDHVNAGSNTDYIHMRFGQRSGNDDGSSAYQIKLWGHWDGADNTFPRSWTLTWDLTSVRDYLESMPQDNWDHISLRTPSGDGMLIHRVVVVHSGWEILDWTVNRWLDAPDETTLGCAAMITERKLQHVGHSDHAAIHAGALEIGKTNGYKYGTGNLWCSEFASWALWKEGWPTPAGNIGTDNMKAWFAARGRLYTRAQVRNKTYVPKQGDYLSINNGGHSCLFLDWLDPTGTITDGTRFRTLDGNWSQTVRIVERTVAEIDRVGKAQ